MRRGMKRAGVTAIRYARSVASVPLMPIEKRLLALSSPAASTPLFIVGVPRSGTTIAYQLATHCLRLSYFPNIANILYQVPVVANRIGQSVLRPYKTDFDSRFGYSRGLMAPSEGGRIWRRWFGITPKEECQGRKSVAVGEMKRLQQTIACIEADGAAPFVNKNVFSSVRIHELSEIFPKSLFLQVSRSPLEVAASILRGRDTVLGRRDRWWSVLPTGIADPGRLDVYEQIAAQIYHTDTGIKRAFDELNPQRWAIATYEEICRSPNQYVDSVRELFLGNGIRVENNYPVPEAFRAASSVSRADANELQRLKSCLEEYYRQEELGDHG